MEYHCSEEKSVPSQIFKKGMDLFGDEIEYVSRYLGFLISINDENSKPGSLIVVCSWPIFYLDAWALFKWVITAFPPDGVVGLGSHVIM